MRIAILSDAILPYHHGGKETLQHERSIRLARRGHAVRIHTMHWWPEREPEIVRDGVALHAIAPRVRMYTADGRRSIWQSVVMGVASLRLLWSEPFDVLDVDQFPFTPFFAASIVCRLRRRPMAATWYEVWDRAYWRRYMGWLGPIGFWMQRMAARQADLLFADSALTAGRLTSSLGVDPRRVIVLSPGVRQEPAPDQPPAKEVDCIFIGRLLAHKNVNVLLRALAKLPDVTGLIVGKGPEKQRLMALAADLGLRDRVRFESVDAHEAAQQRLSASRLLVFPSTREGFGVAVLEANACGVPALVVRHEDNASLELVKDGENGFIVELDIDAIAARIRAYLADDLGQARMSRAARAKAAAFSWDSYADRMEAALVSLTSAATEKAA